MPPWKPAPGHGTFADVRRLSDEQVALLDEWVKDGAPLGDPTAPPRMEAAKEWELGTPDLVLTMPEPYTTPGEGADVIRSFVVPVPAGRGRLSEPSNFNPATRGSSTTPISKSMRTDPHGGSKPGMRPPLDGSSRDVRFPDGYFLGWTPGQRGYSSPGDAW